MFYQYTCESPDLERPNEPPSVSTFRNRGHEKALLRRALAQVRPPAHLARVPKDVLFSSRVHLWLTERGLPRPTLLELEAERWLRSERRLVRKAA